MADKKIIAVIGSTGTQGGGVVRAIVLDNTVRLIQSPDATARLSSAIDEIDATIRHLQAVSRGLSVAPGPAFSASGARAVTRTRSRNAAAPCTATIVCPSRSET